MTAGDSRYPAPPATTGSSGGTRRVGFELEFGGVGIEQAARALQRCLGGELHMISAAQARLQPSGLGEFVVEVDWQYLKRLARERDDIDERWLALLRDLATAVVPVEVVCPPIALDRLGVLDAVVAVLREAGAVGTGDSPIYAFGVHVNAEVPALTAATITRYLKAYCLLQWWLIADAEVDLARRLSPYIDLYPEAYIKVVLDYGDAPELATLFDDYLAHNPTRNRALDLLPLLAEIDRQRVDAVLADSRIKPRPAFHYRIPDCHIERPDWSCAVAWHSWLVVERLAADAAAIAELSERFSDDDRLLLGVNRARWTEYLDAWLNGRSWV